MGCCPRAGVGQTFGQGIELVAAVEAPGEAGQVALGVLGADVMVGAGECRLDVAERGVDTAALGGSDREASAGEDGAGVKGTHLAAFGPEPVTMGKWSQPASLTAVQQDRPSVTTLLPAARSRLASVAISFLRKPLTTVSLSRLGLRSAVVSTAATNGVLPAAPRPR